MSSSKIRISEGKNFSLDVVRGCLVLREQVFVNERKIKRPFVIDGLDYDRKVFHIGIFTSRLGCIASVRGNHSYKCPPHTPTVHLEFVTAIGGSPLKLVRKLLDKFEDVSRALGFHLIVADIPFEERDLFTERGYQDYQPFIKFGVMYDHTVKDIS